MSKQLMLALGAGGAAAAAVVASAASIGTVNSTDLAAGTGVVAPCDSDGIDVTYTTAYNAATDQYDVTTVTLAGVADACIGQRVKITLNDGTVSLDEADVAAPTYTGGVDAQTADFTVAAPAADVTGVAVVISG